MSKILYLFTAFICVSTFAKAEPIIIKTSTISEERLVAGFDGIASSGNVDVILKMGSKESLRLEGDADQIADLITEVSGKTLNIRPKTKLYNGDKYKNTKVIAYVTFKYLNRVILSGSGEMRVESPINSDKFLTTLSGSGKIRVNASVHSFIGVISGSGTVTITGETEDANITLSGSGKFAGKDFAIENLSAQVSGSGRIETKVSDNLKAVLSGSGSIYYSGNPRIDKTSIGSGRIRKI